MENDNGKTNQLVLSVDWLLLAGLPGVGVGEPPQQPTGHSGEQLPGVSWGAGTVGPMPRN